MNFEQQRERYCNDAEFHTLVDLIYNFLMQGNFTVGELKNAVVFAGIKFESEQVNRMIKPLDWRGY